MEIIDIMYCTIHGGGIVYFAMLAFYMVHSRRSLFTENAPRKYLRLHTGIALLCWSLSYLSGLILYCIQPADPSYANNCGLLVDLVLCAPATILMIHTTTFRGRIRYINTIVSGAIGSLLTLLYILTGSIAVLYTTIVFWALVAIRFIYRFIRQTRSYRQFIRDEYSDLEHREIRWLNRASWFIIVYGILYALSQLAGMTGLLDMAYLVTAIGWAYVVYCVDNQKVVHNLITDEKVYLETMSESTGAETNGADVDGNAEPEVLSELEQLLQKECVENKLFLQSDLTINALAAAVRSNRTYLWRHFRDKGMNFHSYINGLRFQYARQLLLSRSNPNISEIARESGFGSDATFRRIFSELQGCTPSQFVAQNLQK